MSAVWCVRKSHRTSCTRFGRASWFVSIPPAMRCGVRNVCRPERPNGPISRGDALVGENFTHTICRKLDTHPVILAFVAAWVHTPPAFTSALYGWRS